MFIEIEKGKFVNKDRISMISTSPELVIVVDGKKIKIERNQEKILKQILKDNTQIVRL